MHFMHAPYRRAGLTSSLAKTEAKGSPPAALIATSSSDDVLYFVEHDPTGSLQPGGLCRKCAESSLDCFAFLGRSTVATGRSAYEVTRQCAQLGVQICKRVLGPGNFINPWVQRSYRCRFKVQHLPTSVSWLQSSQDSKDAEPLSGLYTAHMWTGRSLLFFL